MITIAKRYSDFPFAHRQPNHEGHCAQVHGHNWSFEFTFQATKLDGNGFVIDFGGLKWLRRWLEEQFDHTLVLNESDPQVQLFQGMAVAGLANLVLVPNCGAEGLAVYIYKTVQDLVQHRTEGRVSLAAVTVFEDTRNSATYCPAPQFTNEAIS